MKLIVQYKDKNLSLEDVKEILQQKETESLKSTESESEILKEKLQEFNEELLVVISLLEKEDIQGRVLPKQQTHESIALIQSILLLLC